MTKIKIEIKNRWTGNVMFEYEKENNTLKDTVVEAVKQGANLEGANLKGAYLKGANLEGAYLYVSDNEIDIDEVVENLENNSDLKIKETYINRNIIPTRWNCFWKYGLIICDWEAKEDKPEPKKMTVSEICKELGYDVEIVKEENNE